MQTEKSAVGSQPPVVKSEVARCSALGEAQEKFSSGCNLTRAIACASLFVVSPCQAAAQPEFRRRNPIGHPLRSATTPAKWMKRTIHITGKIEPFFGTLDENIRSLEELLHVRTHLHDTRLTVEGEQEWVDQAIRIVEEYNHLTRHGRELSSAEVKSLMRVATEEPHESPRGMFEHGRARSFGKKQVTPKTATQRRYMEEIESHDMTFGIGPGGTGKTYLAVAMAVSALLTKQVNRIILARPAVEAGERLGFLPGTLQEKIDPYLRPLYDALFDMLDPERVERYLEKNVIEIAPIAFMRGRTLNDSFVILDEAQNTTSEQMKMFVTRLGFNSKAVITGDITQIDLPNARRSGLLEAIDILQAVNGLAFVHFDESDVVRHHLVQRIIRAYDEHKAKLAEQQVNLLEAKASAEAKPSNGLNGAAELSSARLAEEPRVQE